MKGMRRSVARDLAIETGYPESECLEFLENNHVFENWTEEEMSIRPVSLSELAECMAEQKGA